MKTGLDIGDLELTWLNGGIFGLDGGAMFGVVPKPLWQKKYPSGEANTIPLNAWPILVRTPAGLVVIESGLGSKLTDKQRKNYQVREEWSVPAELEKLGIRREDVQYVILTHYDFDHAGGVVMQDGDGTLALTFPEAKHIVQQAEWEDVLNPNIRSKNTYWQVNIETLQQSGNLELVNGGAEVVAGISVVPTGGHTRGHQIVAMGSQGRTALHLGDLLPTHAHANPLWIMAYDNFPLESIALKEHWIRKGVAQNAWFTFYHDAMLRACRFDDTGKVAERWPEEGVPDA